MNIFTVLIERRGILKAASGDYPETRIALGGSEPGVNIANLLRLLPLMD